MTLMILRFADERFLTKTKLYYMQTELMQSADTPSTLDTNTFQKDKTTQKGKVIGS